MTLRALPPVACFVAVVLAAGAAPADTRSPSKPAASASAHATEAPLTGDDEEARAAFVLGSERTRESRWAEALEAYERSLAKRAHPVTTFNVGVCERALGHATRAERAFASALAEDQRSHVLPEPVRRDAETFLAETRATLSEVELVVSPGDAAVLVDGRPLVVGPEPGTFVAGLASPGRAAPLGAGPELRARLRADPGLHVILVSKQGFADVVRRETWAPGRGARLALVLDRLPGRIAVTSAPAGGVVTLDGLDVGEAPVALERAPGLHHVRVRQRGYVPYDVDVSVRAGEALSLDAKLSKESPSLLGRWWFWGGVASVVAGAAVVTYFVARPEPTAPAPNGGGLGWVLTVP